MRYVLFFGILLYFGVSTNLLWYICYKWFIFFPLDTLIPWAHYLLDVHVFLHALCDWCPNEYLGRTYTTFVAFNWWIFKETIDFWGWGHTGYILMTMIWDEYPFHFFSQDSFIF